MNFSMSAVEQLVATLEQRGIRIWSDEQGRLRFKAPKGALTPELEEQLRFHKEQLLAHVQEAQQAARLPQAVPDPDNRGQPFPLTDIQEAYWLGRGDSFALHAPTHYYDEYACRGLDPARLERAWQALIARHEMLRAVILPSGEQRILTEVPLYSLPVDDLRQADAATVTRHLESVCAAMFAAPFAPTRWPLFGLRLSLLPDGEQRVHLAVDMLIVDWGSYGILLREWGQLYQAPERELPALELSFRDYVSAERALRQTEHYRRAERYWRERVATLLPPPALPLAADPSQPTTARFRRHLANVGEAHWARLKAAAGRQGMTATSMLLTLFAEVLAYWSRQPRFTLNLTLFNRLPLADQEQVNRLVGDFTSLTMLEIDHGDTGSTLAERGRRLQSQLWRDLEQRYFTGVEVLRLLAAQPERLGQGGMPVVFTSALGVVEPGDWPGEVVHGFSQTPQVWLDCQVAERGGELVVCWDVLEDLFPAGLVPTLFAAYLDLLQRLALDEGLWDLTRVDLLPPSQQALWQRMNATRMALTDDLLHTPFIARAKARPAQPAIITPQRTLSYGELLHEASQVARWLRDHGAGRDQLVAVTMEKGWEQVVAVMGILMAGAAYVPIDPEQPAERQRYLLAQGEVRLVLTQSRLAGRLPLGECDHLCVDSMSRLGLEPLDPLAHLPAPGDLAYVIYTSGSTGYPKGVMIDHRGAVNTIVDVNRRFGVGEGDRVLALSALNFDLSVYDIFGLLAAGGALVVPAPEGRRDPSHWAELMCTHAVTLWNSVPALMQMLVDYQHQRALDCPLRLVLMSGDWIPLELPERIRQLWPECALMSLGGATEASIWSIYYPIGEVDPRWHSIPYGRPLANQTFHVLDERLDPAPVWVPGQLYIGGVGLALGYRGDAEKTAASFISHPVTGERLYRTGDLGRYLPDGDIEFLGREDFQVKIRGHRIELGEIEYQLARHPRVREAVVSVCGQTRHDRQLVAYIVAEDDAAAEQAVDQAVYGLQVMQGVLSDPLERLQFKLQQHGIRRFATPLPEIPLPEPQSGDDAYLQRQSYRHFLPQPVTLEQLGRLLGCLHPRSYAGSVLPKYRYGSAGSLYPVQLYLYVQPGRVTGLEAGCYYYHPLAHRLVRLSSLATMTREQHGGTNALIFDQAAFSLFLVADYQAIEPMYGRSARDFCLLEAGYISQLLMMECPAQDLGLCPIGGLDFEPLRDACGLTPSQEMVHSFMGGAISEQQKCRLTQGGSPVDRLEEQLERYLAHKLPAYMVPARFVRLPRLPLTANGKIDRKALPQPDLVGLSQERAAPATALERQLAEMACALFELEGIGVTDDFLELGADSIRLVQLHSAIGQQLHRKVTIADMFRHSSVRALAAVIAQAEVSAAVPSPRSAGAAIASDDPEALDRLAANLDQLSADEVEQWLARLGQ